MSPFAARVLAKAFGKGPWPNAQESAVELLQPATDSRRLKASWLEIK